MNPEIEQQVVNILRTEILLGSDRPISPAATLAELGLDSLASINFLTAIESAFSTEITEKVLAAERPLTLRDIAALLADSPAPATATAPPRPVVDAESLPPMGHRAEVLEAEFSGRGWSGAIAWRILRPTWPILANLYAPGAEYVVLERTLDSPVPVVRIPRDIELRAYRPADREKLPGLWPAYLVPSLLAKTDRWFARGASAFVAVQSGRIVGLNVVSDTGEPGEVQLRARKDARRDSWGIYLREAPDCRSRGIGIALLAHALADRQARGYRAEWTTVRTANTPMLVATTQLLGYRSAGRATRTRLLGVNRWTWDVQSRTGKGSILEV